MKIYFKNFTLIFIRYLNHLFTETYTIKKEVTQSHIKKIWNKFCNFFKNFSYKRCIVLRNNIKMIKNLKKRSSGIIFVAFFAKKVYYKICAILFYNFFKKSNISLYEFIKLHELAIFLKRDNKEVCLTLNKLAYDS